MVSQEVCLFGPTVAPPAPCVAMESSSIAPHVGKSHADYAAKRAELLAKADALRAEADAIDLSSEVIDSMRRVNLAEDEANRRSKQAAADTRSKIALQQERCVGRFPPAQHDPIPRTLTPPDRPLPPGADSKRWWCQMVATSMRRWSGRWSRASGRRRQLPQWRRPVETSTPRRWSEKRRCSSWSLRRGSTRPRAASCLDLSLALGLAHVGVTRVHPSRGFGRPPTLLLSA